MYVSWRREPLACLTSEIDLHTRVMVEGLHNSTGAVWHRYEYRFTDATVTASMHPLLHGEVQHTATVKGCTFAWQAMRFESIAGEFGPVEFSFNGDADAFLIWLCAHESA